MLTKIYDLHGGMMFYFPHEEDEVYMRVKCSTWNLDGYVCLSNGDFFNFHYIDHDTMGIPLVNGKSVAYQLRNPEEQ